MDPSACDHDVLISMQDGDFETARGHALQLLLKFRFRNRFDRFEQLRKPCCLLRQIQQIEDRRNEDAAADVVFRTGNLTHWSRISLLEDATHSDCGIRLRGHYPVREKLVSLSLRELYHAVSDKPSRCPRQCDRQTVPL
jgi:hypothetical protein